MSSQNADYWGYNWPIYVWGFRINKTITTSCIGDIGISPVENEKPYRRRIFGAKQKKISSMQSRSDDGKKKKYKAVNEWKNITTIGRIYTFFWKSALDKTRCLWGKAIKTHTKF